jgi:hypothetical protein
MSNGFNFPAPEFAYGERLDGTFNAQVAAGVQVVT